MKRFLDAYYRLLQVLITLLMGLLIVPVTMQIVSRYTGLIPRYIWTEEIARFCFIWIIMIGAMIAVRDGSHFTVDLLPDAKSTRGEAVRRLFADFIVFLVAMIFIVWGWPLVLFGLLQTSEISELPMVTIYIAWPLAGVTWILFLGEKTVENIKVMRSHRG
jgi:TRAP-type C4-dicarboxylate transport system permease small subunit